MPWSARRPDFRSGALGERGDATGENPSKRKGIPALLTLWGKQLSRARSPAWSAHEEDRLLGRNQSLGPVRPEGGARLA